MSRQRENETRILDSLTTRNIIDMVLNRELQINSTLNAISGTAQPCKVRAGITSALNCDK